MQLRRRLAIIAGLYLVIFVVGGAMMAGALRSWSRQLDDRRTLFVAAERVATLRSAYLDQETGVRGFVITGQQTFLEPYQRGMEEAASVIAELRASLAKVNVPVANLDAVQHASDDWEAQAAQPAITGREHGLSTFKMQALTDHSKVLFDQLRGRLDATAKEIDAHASATNDASSNDRALLVVAVAVVFGLVVALTIAVVGLLHRWLVVPLAAITDATNRIGHGENAPLATRGPPELRRVAAAIDRMQLTIRSQRDSAVNAREALEQNAVIALRLRDELAHEVGVYPDGWQVAAGLRPAEGLVAGDCYDVSLLGPSSIGLVVLDISGHGALAAIAAFRCKELLKVALRNGLAPGAALEWLYEQPLGLDDGFFTAIVAAIDTDSGTCRYANAGHPPAIAVAADATVGYLAPTGPLFGPVPPGWRTAEVEIGRGTMVAVFTDGLVEARSAAREFFGDDRLEATLVAAAHDPDEVVDRVLDDVAGFRGGRQTDDVTLVVLCRGTVDGDDGATLAATPIGNAESSIVDQEV